MVVRRDFITAVRVAAAGEINGGIPEVRTLVSGRCPDSVVKEGAAGGVSTVVVTVSVVNVEAIALPPLLMLWWI